MMPTMASQVLPRGGSGKHFVEAFDMVLGLILVLLKGFLQLFRLRRLSHLGKRAEYFLFDEIDVF